MNHFKIHFSQHQIRNLAQQQFNWKKRAKSYLVFANKCIMAKGIIGV